jgi:hypothetical protein
MPRGILCSEDLIDRTGKKAKFSPSTAARAVMEAFPIASVRGCRRYRNGLVFLYDDAEPLWDAEAYLRVAFDELSGDLATRAATRETIALIEDILALEPRMQSPAGLLYRKLGA